MEFGKRTLAGLALVAGLTLVAGSPLRAATSAKDPEQTRGYRIAALQDRSDRGFSSSVAQLKMVLRNGAGAEFTRTMRLSTVEEPDEWAGDKSIVEFISPPDVEGTALLSHGKIRDADDQWLFIPALKRVKRIATANKSGPFVGSEFAYEDITAEELNKYDYRFVRREPCGELSCEVVERIPQYDHSGYSHQLVWIDERDHQLRKVEYYDRSGGRSKTLLLEEYRLFDQRYWRPMRMTMKNHMTGKETDLIYSDYRFGQSLSAADMTPAALKRLR